MNPTTQQTVFAKVICELVHELPKCLIVRQGKVMFRFPKSKIKGWHNINSEKISVLIEDLFCREFGVIELA